MPKLTGDEPILGADGATVFDFWRWGFSDILSNAERGVFAEFLVSSALGVTSEPRVEWDAVDLKYRGIGIEVKSSAYLQSWQQSKPSAIRFDIARKRSWDASTNTTSKDLRRSADIYAFCLFRTKDAESANVLDMDQWEFYVVSTATINDEFGEQKTVALSRVAAISNAVPYSCLRSSVDGVVSSLRHQIERLAGPA